MITDCVKLTKLSTMICNSYRSPWVGGQLSPPTEPFRGLVYLHWGSSCPSSRSSCTELRDVRGQSLSNHIPLSRTQSQGKQVPLSERRKNQTLVDSWQYPHKENSKTNRTGRVKGSWEEGASWTETSQSEAKVIQMCQSFYLSTTKWKNTSS